MSLSECVHLSSDRLRAEPQPPGCAQKAVLPVVLGPWLTQTPAHALPRASPLKPTDLALSGRAEHAGGRGGLPCWAPASSSLQPNHVGSLAYFSNTPLWRFIAFALLFLGLQRFIGF